MRVKFKAEKGTWTVCHTKLAPATKSLPVVMPIGSEVEEEESVEAIARFIANHKVKFSIVSKSMAKPKLCNQVHSLSLFRWRTLTYSVENIKRLCVFIFQT